QLNVEAAGEHSIEVLEQRVDLRHGAVRCERHQIAIGSRLAAAVDEHLGGQRGDGIVDVDLVVVDGQAHALERTGAHHGESVGRGLCDFRYQIGVAAAD